MLTLPEFLAWRDEFRASIKRAHDGGHDTRAVSDATAIMCKDESLTVQSMAADTDLNVLMRRFGVTGKMPEDIRVPSYGDYADITDFQSAMNSVIAAQEEFMRMPADVRSQFDNSPHKFLEFCSDERNKDKMRQLGLLRPQTQAELAAERQLRFNEWSASLTDAERAAIVPPSPPAGGSGAAK